MSTPQPAEALRIARIIWFALMGGVVAFAAVAFALWQAGRVPMDPARADTAWVFLWAWLAIAVGSSIACMSFWRVKVSPLVEPRRSGAAVPADPGRAVELQTGLIICWALLEGAALAAIVFFVLFGGPLLLALGVVYLLVTFGLTAPRTEWFDGAGGIR